MSIVCPYRISQVSSRCEEVLVENCLSIRPGESPRSGNSDKRGVQAVPFSKSDETTRIPRYTSCSSGSRKDRRKVQVLAAQVIKETFQKQTSTEKRTESAPIGVLHWDDGDDPVKRVYPLHLSCPWSTRGHSSCHKQTIQYRPPTQRDSTASQPHNLHGVYRKVCTLIQRDKTKDRNHSCT
ncbi:hypothetical protein IRJ41_005778 [Triplophysa rosa]|uniref:Uncharacterized protein n=1 Tax=Triplophysa rosa TaxID=992332 RepID=A0A9W8C8L8_TRIRA|nr:hypothetical protein IRJ41_005778 [Triplophysa rosa]